MKRDSENMKNVYRFVHDREIPPLESLKSGVAYQLMEKLNSGIPLSREEKTGGIFDELFRYETYRTGRYRLQGYIFDFSPYMKTFLVKTKYYGWQEIISFDRTSIRTNSATPSWILKIIEL